jgi:antitoxin component YwqK of YwqJK toxin-antitoxin module
MFKKKKYTNGNNIYKLEEKTLTYYFKNGNVKAKGRYIKNRMEGEWLFYRESGQLWQIGNFRNGIKNGRWVIYDRENRVEDEEEYINGQRV